MRKLLLPLAAVLLIANNGGCDDSTPPAAKDTAAVRGQAMAASVVSHASENAEQNNIQRRLKLTMNPGQIGFIALFNPGTSEPIAYYSVMGKVTSSHKRLTPPGTNGNNCYEGKCQDDKQAPGDDGTFGDSDSYIFFWDTDGAYHQWSGSYLYSDKPFRLSTPPLVVSVAPNK